MAGIKAMRVKTKATRRLPAADPAFAARGES
jgi:hypothetical protein